VTDMPDAEITSSHARARKEKEVKKMPRHTHTWVLNRYMTTLDDMAWWEDCECGAQRETRIGRPGTRIYSPADRRIAY